MGSIFQRTLLATRASIAEAADELAAWLDAAHVAEPAALLARLALDELATNLAVHAGRPLPTMNFECRQASGELTIRVDDDGPAFDPLEAPRPDLDGPVEQRRVGGLGIHLLRELADRFDYERTGGRNRVTLVRKSPLPGDA